MRGRRLCNEAVVLMLDGWKFVYPFFPYYVSADERLVVLSTKVGLSWGGGFVMVAFGGGGFIMEEEIGIY